MDIAPPRFGRALMGARGDAIVGNYYAGMMNNTGGYGELRHHGILGQKWGVRRFQNADGSLTAAGKERYYVGKIPASSKEGEKDFKRYMRLQGTKSLLGGDHSHDASVKALTDYHNELYSKRKELKFIANRKGKDQYRDAAQKIAEKHIDKYAKAVLKDMGYDTTDATIAWLKKQPWFYMRGANDIVF